MFERLTITVGTVVAVLAVITLFAGASKPSSPDASGFARRSDIQNLETSQSEQLRVTNSELERLRQADADLTLAMQAIAKRLEESNNRMTVISNQLNQYSTTEDLASVDVSLRNLIKLLDDRMEESDRLAKLHGSILDTVARRTSDDRYLPNILANMDLGSDEANAFREEMESVVNRSIRKESTLEITNETLVTKQITINENRTYDLRPGETWKVKDVPTGNVTTRLAGQQSVNWAIGPPRYSLKLRIIDRGPVTTYSWTPVF